MHRPTIRASAIALCVVLAAASPASARGVEKRGHCSGGPGDWKLTVQSEDGGKKLRVRFEIDHIPAGQTWQVFLSDDGVGIFSGTRRTDGEGDLRVTVFPSNRRGADRVAASGVNPGSGVSCEGSVAF